MARKPVDKLRPDERREAVWAAIRELQEFTVHELWLHTRLAKDSIRDYVLALERGGYLARAGKRTQPGSRPVQIFALVRDCGIEAPRLRKDGSEVTAGRGREQMWHTMRILGEFSARDLAVHAATEEHPVAEEEAKSYSHYLHKAGYLALVRPGKPGSPHSPGQLARYRFIARKHTGPRPPQIQRVKQVYDPNLGQVVWSGSADAEAMADKEGRR